ncbi:MAG: rhomboid family intramembrane serine protease [Treponema sp.]|nr:rhomboid family intramembrane serine protease [Treponema sp.]
MNIIRKPFRYTFSNATLWLVALNLLVFFAELVVPRLQVYLGLSMAGIHYRYYWQFVTYMFVHGSWSHIIFNMFALFVFGMQVERSIGTKEFILFYILCGLLSGLLSEAAYWFLGWNVLLMGASGAIYALLLAYAVIFPRNILFVMGIVPVPAPLLVLIYAGIEVFSQIFAPGGVAHLAHLFGFAAAWLYFVIRMGIHPLRVWHSAWRR